MGSLGTDLKVKSEVGRLALVDHGRDGSRRGRNIKILFFFIFGTAAPIYVRGKP